jgi:hypothetical protein
MLIEIHWTKDGYTRITKCISSERIALKYALMREKQGYDVEIHVISLP